MINDGTGSPVRSTGNPALRVLAGFPFACFSGALLSDIAYAVTANMIWADFSAWALAIGMATGVALAIVGGILMLVHRRSRPRSRVWLVVLGSLVVLAVAFLNNLVHSRDAWTSVVPEGLALSAVTVAVMLLIIWFDATVVQRPVLAIQYSGARR
jgi:uncharacterized membrane protein